jgi:hypothetical protein
MQVRLIGLVCIIVGLGGVLWESEQQPTKHTDTSTNCLHVRRFTVLGYPAIARQLRVEGEVSAKVRLSPDGSVDSVVEMKGPSLLQDRVKQSLREWVFEGCIAEHPTVEVSFSYSLQGEEGIPNRSYVVTGELPYKVQVITNPGQGPRPDVR